MKDSRFVHESWSSNRVPEMIQNMHRVPIEFPNFLSKLLLNVTFNHLLIFLA